MIFRRGSGSLWRRLKLLLPVGRTSRTDHSIYKKHMNLPRFLLPLLLLGSAMPPAGATLALAPVFGANMVLQRGKPVPVSGTATANKAITVAFNLQTKATTADAAGNWQVTLDAMVANASGGNFTATEAGANTVTLANVVVGDVWICSGQSNMAFGLGGCNRQVDIDSANFPALRQFSAPLVTSDTALKTITGGWTACSPGTASGFSAVAFYFGRKICQDQSSAIPIGLFVSSVGGTRIDPWLAPEGAVDIPVLAPLFSQSILPWGPFALFNGMVYPYSPLPAKGLVWYQGENSETTTQSVDSYFLKMKALAQGYKRMSGLDDFAFYFVQIANWGTQAADATPVLISGGWDADTRIQQANAMALPHAGMASALDIGDSADMHPLDKLDLGERLALWALKNDYGRPITETSGPILKDVTLSGSTLVCTFDHIGNGLMVGSKTPYLPTAEVAGGSLQKFSVAAASGAWYAATATIVGNTVVVSSPSVGSPRRVAYACWQNPVGCNLYNKDGLPASPFYVDDVNAKYTVTASAGTGGGISPAGVSTYLKRKTALYTITPDAGSYIADVKVDNVSVGAVKFYTFDPLYANHTIAASFAASAPNFTVAASAAAGGTISPSGPVSVGQGSSQGFTVASSPGAIITLTVDGASMGQRTGYTFGDVREPHTIGAAFTFPINAQAGYGGSITPSGSTVVAYGANQTYGVVAQTGFAIAKVTVDGVNVGSSSSYTFTNVTASHAITATFTGTGGSGSVPQTGKIYCSFLTDNLPASGTISSWASYLPSGKTLTPQGTPSVEVIDSRKFVRNVYNDSDGLNMGTVASASPCTGATVVVVVKPTRFGSDQGWTSVVDFFYDRLVLGVLNGSGAVVVKRNGVQNTSTATIPDGQTTILSLVIQQSGAYKVYANGSLVMDITATSDMSAIVPGGSALSYGNNVTFGRNWPDGWTTYNGCYGDSFVYTTALTDAERQQLETYLVNRLTATGPTYAITASAGAGGSISPAGAVSVGAGASQAFTITPNSGYVISQVAVDGTNQGAMGTYTFTNVAATHTIAATFVAGLANTLPTISAVAAQSIVPNTATAALAFTVNDAETPAASLSVTAASSNITLVPIANVVLGGSGTNRSVQVTPAANQTGSTTITLTVSDGVLTAACSFVVTVAAPSASKAISINVGYNGTLAAGDSAGVVPAACWNELSGANNPSSSALVDESGGAVSGMTASFQGNGNTFNWTGVAGQTMLSGFLNGNPMAVTLGNIPFANYDVYIYYAGFAANYSLTWQATNTTTSTVLGTQYSVRGSKSSPQLFADSGFVQSQYNTLALADAAAAGNGGNWLKFTGLSAANLKIAETSSNGNNENGFSGIQIVKTLATPSLALANSPVVYNGSARAAMVNGSVAGTVGNVRYAGLASVPTAAGTYPVTADFTPTDAGGFTSLTAAAAGNFTIQKAPLTVTATGPGKNFGTALSSGPSTANFTATAAVGGEAVTSVTLTPDAAGLSTSAAAGSAYGVVPSLASGSGGFVESNYQVSYIAYSGTIGKAAAAVSLTGLSATFDGTPKHASSTTVPANLRVVYTYNGSASAPVNAGSYAVLATIDEPNYTGTASATLVILDAMAAWRASHFTGAEIAAGLAADAADPDADGRNNLAEFAFNGDPRNGTNTGLFVTRVNAGGLTLTCATRRGAVFAADARHAQVSAAIDGVVYTIEGSESLSGSWDSAVTHLGASDTAPAASGLPDLTSSGWQYHTFSCFSGLSPSGFLRAAVAK